MATTSGPAISGVARGHSIHSSLGTIAPLNTPTRRFYGTQDQIETQPPGVPNPNVYVVQPFKNASIPKDLVYTRKNAPNPAENLLNSTIDLINHFTSCYEAVKHQLQDEHTKERGNVLISRSTTIGGTNNTVSRTSIHRPAKQARLQPLIRHQNQPVRRSDSDEFIENCKGILPVPMPKANELNQVYNERLHVLRRLRPELFDAQGHLLSRNGPRKYSYSEASIPCSKKSAASSFRTPQNTLFTAENIPYDERQTTFLTEFTNEQADDENNEDKQKPAPLVSTQQINSVDDLLKNNFFLKVLEIKTVTKSTKQDRTKSASDKGSYYSQQGNATAKST